METIRANPTWAAYVLSSVIEWVSVSWSQPDRCPDPTKTFEALSRALFVDQQLLDISGSAASSGGGLAVSCAPPSIHLTDACAAWTAWVHSTFAQQDFQSLVDVCAGVRPGSFEKRSLAAQGDSTVDVKNPPRPLELSDIEMSQIEDLTAMRMLPHLLPYRRYIYIGEVTLDQAARDRLGGSVGDGPMLAISLNTGADRIYDREAV